jgi:hypothetical protein
MVCSHWSVKCWILYLERSNRDEAHPPNAMWLNPPPPSAQSTGGGIFMSKFFFCHEKRLGLTFLSLKISKLPNGHELKFLFLSSHYYSFWKLTVLNGWGKDRFITIYKFTYFKLFYIHVASLIFSKQQSWPNKISGFEHEHAVIWWLWNERWFILFIRLCWWCSCVLLLEATCSWWLSDRVFVLKAGCFIWLGLLFKKKSNWSHPFNTVNLQNEW